MNGALLSNEAKVGLFFLSGLLLLLVFSFFLSGVHFTWERGRVYYVELKDAYKIGKDTPVVVAGVRVGRVEEVTLNPQTHKVRVKLRVDKKVVLYLNSRVVIRSAGLLGDRYIEIVPGEESSGVLEEGGTIPQSEVPLSVEEILDRLAPVIENLERVTKDIKTLTGDKAFQEGITAILENIRATTEVLRSLSEGGEEDLRVTIRNLREISTLLRNDLPRILSRLEKGLGELTSALEEIRPGVKESIHRLEEILGEVSASVKRFQEILAQIQTGKGTVGTLLYNEEVSREIERTVRTVGDVARKYGELRTVIDYRGQVERLVGEDRNYGFRHTVNIHLKPRPEKFYSLGIVHTPVFPQTIQDRTTFFYDSFGNVTQETRIREVTGEDRILFNLLFGYRFGFLTLRGGLIESSGGLGIDFAFLRDSLWLRGEVFRFVRLKEKPYLRTWGQFYFLPSLSLTVGVEDLLSPLRPYRYSLGLGITLDDEDLKTLFLSLPSISF